MQHFLNANVDLSMIEINRILMKNNLMLIVVKSERNNPKYIFWRGHSSVDVNKHGELDFRIAGEFQKLAKITVGLYVCNMQVYLRSAAEYCASVLFHFYGVSISLSL